MKAPYRRDGVGWQGVKRRPDVASNVAPNARHQRVFRKQQSPDDQISSKRLMNLNDQKGFKVSFVCESRTKMRTFSNNIWRVSMPKKVLCSLAVSGFVFASSASAVPIALSGTEGLPVIAVGGEVTATYLGNTASYTNILYLDNGNADYSDDFFIFNNKVSPVGSTVNLGLFPSGTELVFRLDVTNTGDRFFSGPASRNPDAEAHARVQSDWKPNETLVSFEDLLNGPFVFNDLSFSFTNTTNTPPSGPATVPLPLPLLMLLTALGTLFASRRVI